jgi:hypothetical protein
LGNGFLLDLSMDFSFWADYGWIENLFTYPEWQGTLWQNEFFGWIGGWVDELFFTKIFGRFFAKIRHAYEKRRSPC